MCVEGSDHSKTTYKTKGIVELDFMHNFKYTKMEYLQRCCHHMSKAIKSLSKNNEYCIYFVKLSITIGKLHILQFSNCNYQSNHF